MNTITVIALPSCGTLLHDYEPMVLFGEYSLDEPITWIDVSGECSGRADNEW